MTNNPSLSLCMIVKDEEHHIKSCLESIKPYVNEMIIVDTGSSDETIPICKAMGASVYSFSWNNNFAEARNYGLERAKGDWIIWMDADERLEQSTSPHSLKLLLKEKQKEFILSIRLINYIGETANPNEAFHISQVRLFRNHMGFKFKHMIHETLNVDDVLSQSKHNTHISNTPLQIHHYGYMEEDVHLKQKFARNMSLLQQVSKLEENNPWNFYHIASEHYRMQQYTKAFQYVNLSIKAFLQAKMAPPSMLYKLKYATLLAQGSIDGAWPGIQKAIELYPDYVDLHFYKGIILYLKECYAKALDTFETCLKLGDDQLHHLILKGTGSFHAYYYKGLCLEKLGQLAKATEAYEEALKIYPAYTFAREALNE